MGDLGGGLAIREKAIALVKDAVDKDKAADYPAAFKLYMSALDHFGIYLKYEKNPMMQQTVKAKFMEYLTRAEELKKLIDSDAATNRANPVNSPDSALRAKPKGGKGGAGEGDDGETAKMKSQLGGAIVTEKPNVKWDDVAGLEAAKAALKEAVIMPVKFPQFFTGKRKAWSGFLLYGPPGTGKSYLAKAVATEADSTFFFNQLIRLGQQVDGRIREAREQPVRHGAGTRAEHHLHRRDRRAVRRARRRRRVRSVPAHQDGDPRPDARRRSVGFGARAGPRRDEHAVPAGPSRTTTVRQAHLHPLTRRGGQGAHVQSAPR
mmetsp:Transcript_2497/g.11295  ORF Transcript_2497/g.11295 Transcript_2497/m.11295 type:complete len:320 (-) Transcript_2497:517-1476(-)